MDLEQLMAARVRRHMVTSIGGFVVALALAMLGGAALRAGFGASAPAWIAVVPMLAILLVPAIGFYSTFKNLRCPSCEKLVIWEVSWNYSLFSRMAPKTCRGCGKQIFGDLLAQRFRRMFVIMFAAGIGLSVVSALLSAVLHH